MTVIDEIAAERQRQVQKEGWSIKHDDTHTRGELALAAACYAKEAALPAVLPLTTKNGTLWPWSLEWWKPKTPRRDLIRAAALIIAEIERLDRKDIRAAGGVKE